MTNRCNRATVLDIMDESSIILERSSNIAPILVDTQQIFDDMMDHLLTQNIVALDSESNSMFRYYPKVCLIQISAYRQRTVAGNSIKVLVDYLIDSLHLENLQINLARLGGLLADPEVEIIIHAAENDILTMQRDFNYKFQNVFDTQLAARILGWRKVGLAALLEENFGQVSNKEMQLADWGQRPLTHEQIEYARMDTHYLFALRDRLLAELEGQGYLQEAQSACAMLSKIDYHERPPSDRNFWQMKGARQAPSNQTAILQELWRWREEVAQKRDLPPFKIMRDPVLIDIASSSSSLHGPRDLARIKRLSSGQIRRYHRDLIKAIRRGEGLPPPPMPDLQRVDLIPDKPTQARFDALRKWRTKTARLRDVDPDIILSNNFLLKIARKNPCSIVELQTISELDPWKAETYSNDILNILKNIR